jgi:hypothetical protein
MRVYKSNSTNTISAIVIVLIGFAALFLFPLWYVLEMLFFLIVFLVIPLSFYLSSNWVILDGYLMQNYEKDLDEITYGFRIKLTEITKIEKEKNLFGKPLVSIYFGYDDCIDIYLKTGEMDEFLNEISEKRDPSV